MIHISPLVLDPSGSLSAHWCSTDFFFCSMLSCGAHTKELSSKRYGKMGRSSNVMVSSPASQPDQMRRHFNSLSSLACSSSVKTQAGAIHFEATTRSCTEHFLQGITTSFTHLLGQQKSTLRSSPERRLSSWTLISSAGAAQLFQTFGQNAAVSTLLGPCSETRVFGG
jgi:hypothetical protein